MENFLHVDQLVHDLGLADISRDAVEHENVDVGFEVMAIDRGVDSRLPELDRDFVRNELAFAGVFQKSAADLGARVDRAKDVAAGAMKKARDAAESFALRAFAAPGRAEEKIGADISSGIVPL